MFPSCNCSGCLKNWGKENHIGDNCTFFAFDKYLKSNVSSKNRPMFIYPKLSLPTQKIKKSDYPKLNLVNPIFPIFRLPERDRQPEN